MSEFRLAGIPAVSNPYDPAVIAVDVAFIGPSGRAISRPAFWHQPYLRRWGRGADGEFEALLRLGAPGWRVRWTPLESGPHRVQVAVARGGTRVVLPLAPVAVAPPPPRARGFVRVEPAVRRYFQTSDRRPLPLLGENVCWHGRRGTFDYDDWFGAMARHQMNYARLWMWHASFGVEFFGAERLRYNQERAWRLDYVLNLAAQRGIYAMLCLDYHGIFEVEPDMWGGNDYWPQHAYNRANGGPCATQNEFFTHPGAKALYRKRLRYLIARWGAYPSLLSWEFFNEINNVYRYLQPDDVVAWHGEMARWLRANDPYKHPITTSFGSTGEQPAMWLLPVLDYAQYHWYATYGGAYQQATVMAGDVAARFRHDFAEPVCIGEFGTDATGPGDGTDPHRRGLRQALWAGVFSGTAGTAMPWWWEQNHAEGLYPLWRSLARFLQGTDFAAAGWGPRPITAPGVGSDLGALDPNGKPFTATITTDGTWGGKPAGTLVLHRAEDAGGAPLNGFIHGTWKADLQNPFRVECWLGQNARFVMHLNAVSDQAILSVALNGQERFRKAYPNKDGLYLVNDEYNLDIPVLLPAGRAVIDVSNPGGDWAFLDQVRVENALPVLSDPTLGPPLEAWAVGDNRGALTLVWVLDYYRVWPKGAGSDAPRVTGGKVTVHGLPDGDYEALWWHTADGRTLGTTRATSVGGDLALAVIDFDSDVAARVRRVA
jgi:hypothetical protein